MEQEPTEDELQQFMNLVDSDKSNTVSFPQFISTLLFFYYRV